MARLELHLDDAIDFTRYFVPEAFTPLFYTPLYAELTPEQRRRYNQLHGCYCNEQIMFFEKFIAENVLSGVGRARGLEAMRPELSVFLNEERRHARMFRDWNLRCLPHLYGRNEFYFVVMPAGLKVVLDWSTKRPWFFALFVWLMLLQEERAVFLGREVLRRKDELEPHFVALQRAHLADEIDHVEWDQEILAAIWGSASAGARRILAALFCRMLEEFMITPKRSNLRVIAELANEFAELKTRFEGMRRALLALECSRDWNLSLYSRATVPKTFALFDRWPEFAPLSRVLCGYWPNSENR
ncbi:MAG TPA: diiron oxygenase [Candidatus Acidoferrales bacterium]|nr:diiron oxygenase [Candidatus Acidoferrales bacterium]